MAKHADNERDPGPGAEGSRNRQQRHVTMPPDTHAHHRVVPPDTHERHGTLPPHAATHSPAILPAKAKKSQGRKSFRPIDAFLALVTLIIVGVGIAAAGLAYQSFLNAGGGDAGGATAILTYAEQQRGSQPTGTESGEGENKGSEASAIARPNGFSGNRAELKIALQSNPDTNKIAKDYAKVLDAEGYRVEVIGPYPYDRTIVVYRYPEVAEEARHIAEMLGTDRCFQSNTGDPNQYDADILISIGPGIAPAPLV